MDKLVGKVAIVTGAGRGVGRGEALLLAREGAAVVVNDVGGAADGTSRDATPAQAVVDEITAAGGQAVVNHDDVASWDGGQRLVRQAVQTFGGLDILVCNAGIIRDRMLFKMSEAEWDSVINVHLKGHFVPTRFACEHWRERSKALDGPADGRIVFTSSTAGLYSNAGQSNYVAAKAGIAAMAVSVAREMARYGVTCNTVCPAARTRLTEAAFGDALSVRAADGFDAFDPENVAPWVAYLCTDDAADISGQTFTVMSGIVELVAGWGPASQITKPGRWTVEELVQARAELFEGRSTQVPERPPMPEVPGADRVVELRAEKAKR